MLNIILIIGAAIIFILAVNVLIYKLIVYKGKHKFILPFLKMRGWDLVDICHVGLLNSGDFNVKATITFISEMGNIINHTYVYVTARKPDSQLIKFTAKIVTVFFWIKTVTYKGKGL